MKLNDQSIEEIFELIKDGMFDDALLKCQLITGQGINHPAIFLALGIIFQEKEDYDNAILNLLKALNLDPSNEFIFNEIGVAFLKKNDIGKSNLFFDKALKINPSFVDAISNKGIALFKLEDFQGALNLFNEAISLDVNYYEAYIGRGNVYNELGLSEQALNDYDFSLKLNPDYPLGHFNKGNFYKDTKDYANALKSYDRALVINSNFNEAIWNKANVLLKTGDFTQGFKLYESRWKTKFLKDSYRKYNKPIWTGNEDITNKKIFIYCEQGFGDMIQFSRYITLLSDMGATVLLEAPECLVALFSTLKGNLSFLESQNLATSHFDFYCPMMSLPLAFKTKVETIPKFNYYLSANEQKKELWHEILKPLKGLKVGLVWSGGVKSFTEETSKVTRNKSIPLDSLSILKNEKINFISLQKGEQAERELKNLSAGNWAGPIIYEYSSKLKDFSDTAALIANLDLVISVCTSVAHLSGAIGKKTWIMIPHHPCWRWFDDESEASPWYPSVKLFRQKEKHTWHDVLERVAEELKKITDLKEALL